MRTEPIEQAWSGRTLSSLRSCGLRGVGNWPCRSPVAFPRAARDEQFVMLADASIQNTTALQGLPLGAAFDDFATCVAASLCPDGWIPVLRSGLEAMTRLGLARRDAAVVSRRRLRDRPPARLVGKATSRRPELVHDRAGTRARIASAREGGRTMKLGICIAILFLALAGGVASAITAQLLPAHADPCGGYSCETAGVSDDFRRGS